MNFWTSSPPLVVGVVAPDVLERVHPQSRRLNRMFLHEDGVAFVDPGRFEAKVFDQRS